MDVSGLQRTAKYHAVADAGPCLIPDTVLQRMNTPTPDSKGLEE